MFHLNLTILVIILCCFASSYSKNASDYRLPDNNVPKSYVLRLIIDPDSDEFSGKVKISFSTKNKTNSIQLHASSEFLKINEVILNAVHVCKVSKVDKETDIANIICPTSIEEGSYSEIQINFNGVYGIYNGLYKENYKYKSKTEYGVASQFEATHARKAFPCFDEPQLKAEFDIMLVHPKNYNALSNTPVTYRTTADPYIFTKFKKTPIMSTYLLAFVVSKLSKKDSSTSEKSPFAFPISIYYRPDLENNTRTALRYGGNLIHAHSTFTGISYDELGDSKMDFVGLPHFGGGMENWGLILCGEGGLLDDGNKTTPEHEQTIISLMAHELAHQWFGDYVTLDWWSDVWLNEGFANFFEMHFDENILGTNMELERQFIPIFLHVALETDEGAVNPLSNKNEEIFTPQNIDDKFDAVSYDKGASVIRMMRAILGKENFQKGIQQYLQENGHKTAKSSLLLNTLSAFYNNSNHSFEELLHNWVYKIGHPLVNVSLNADGKSVEIKQDFFTGNSEWYIPITYTTSKDKNFNIIIDNWLMDKPLNVQLAENSWIIVNLQQIGFYRVNYDTALWNRITAALKSKEMKEIHVSNRAQLLDDAFVLAEKKKLSYNITFALAEYVKQETEYEPWFVIKKRIKKIIINMKDQKEAIKQMKKRILGWINEAFPDKDKNITTHLQKITYNMIVSFKAYLEDEATLREAQAIYKKYINQKYIEDYNKRKMSICYGLMLSETPKIDYDILLGYYEESDSAYERQEILSSLGCTNDPKILKMFLSEVLLENTRILKTNVNKVFRAVYNNYKHGLDLFLTFLDQNMEELGEKYEEILKLPKIIWKLVNKVVTKQQLSKVEKIILKHQKLYNTMDVEAKLLATISDRVSRQNQNIENILTVLSSS